jgi:hypothetical protein
MMAIREVKETRKCIKGIDYEVRNIEVIDFLIYRNDTLSINTLYSKQLEREAMHKLSSAKRIKLSKNSLSR